MQAREELRRLKYIALMTWAADVIRKWFYGWQARKQLRAMKYAIQVEKSALVIQKYFRGWQVGGRVGGGGGWEEREDRFKGWEGRLEGGRVGWRVGVEW